MVQATGKNTYLAIKKIPLITANDIATIAAVSVTSATFSNNNNQITAALVAEKLILNKMAATEQSIFKNTWKHGIKNYRTIATINQWFHNHPKITIISQSILKEFVISSIVFGSPYSNT